MKTIITDAFLINMLTSRSTVQFRPLSLAEAKEFFLPGYLGKAAEWESAVGHPDMAVVFSEQLGFEVKANRVTIQLDYGTRLLVGQYSDPRLEAGTTDICYNRGGSSPPLNLFAMLAEGATIQWWLVTRGGNNV